LKSNHTKLIPALHAHIQGDLDKAEQIYSQFVNQDFADILSCYLRALVNIERGNLETGREYLETAFKICSGTKYSNEYGKESLCVIIKDRLNQIDKNIEYCLDKDSLVAIWFVLGQILLDQGEFDGAEQCLKQAWQYDLEKWKAFIFWGDIKQGKGQYEEALQALAKAVQIESTQAIACKKLGDLYDLLGDQGLAFSYYEKAVTLEPKNPVLVGVLVEKMRSKCMWTEIEKYELWLLENMRQGLSIGGQSPVSPFLALTLTSDPLEHLAVAESWNHGLIETVRSLQRQMKSRKNNKCLTIGYLSGNFRNHATAHLISGLLKNHDHNQFRICCYACAPIDDSFYVKQIKANCSQLVNLTGMSYLQAANVIQEDGVDILIDLTGPIKGNGMMISALRPTQVQVRYLGFAGTSGVDFYDYLITDRLVTPPEQASAYKEEFIYLPDTFQINDYQQFSLPFTPKRQDCGLTQDGFVLGCMNAPYKIDPELFALWLRILQQIPESLLWVLQNEATTIDTLRGIAKQQGVSPNRIICALPNPKQMHLARLQLMDIALDTRLINGAATTSDLLWMGIPVVTLQGQYFSSRIGASLLHAAYLSELVATSFSEYEEIVLKLAQKGNFWKQIQEKMKKVRESPLFDAVSKTRYIEQAYKMMWEKEVHG
jgi:predicted O-linked N-acetylglucosamine transferase (SPINDLY family)